MCKTVEIDHDTTAQQLLVKAVPKFDVKFLPKRFMLAQLIGGSLRGGGGEIHMTNIPIEMIKKK